MAGIPKEHDKLYFDVLCRTQKAETVLSLIFATYQAKKSGVADVKTEIAKRLENAYNLFKTNIRGTDSGSGTYSGTMKQFESQYTIGHELCIWANSNLDLTDYALSVAQGTMTIKEYFDIFFLSYFQPIGGKGVHVLYYILKYMIDNGQDYIDKDSIPAALGVGAEKEDINALCNFLNDTSYLSYEDKKLKYVGTEKMESFICRCNTQYIGVDGLSKAKIELDTDEKYIEYIMSGKLHDDIKNADEDKYESPKDKENLDSCVRLNTGKNIILYGVPGAGKSWTIKNEYCDDDDRIERLVFHPDYTYSDFVGQILPKVNEDSSVSYEFSPGPFTNLVEKAYKNPNKEYFLIIEEVNRGNAPAIFGDIFQLLDRNKNGTSEYKITNADIAKIVYGNPNHKVTIPSNMSILCTMNTSDQNVFTLDTAFQRRWSMRLIKNKFRDEESEKTFAETKILDTDVTWEHFFTSINKIILSKNIRMTSSEDKRLGTHFVSDEDLKYLEGNEKQNSRFPEKVLKYLWDDAFKFTKEDIFDLDKVQSLEDVIEIFVTSSKNDRLKVFKENIYNTLVKKNNENA